MDLSVSFQLIFGIIATRLALTGLWLKRKDIGSMPVEQVLGGT